MASARRLALDGTNPIRLVAWARASGEEGGLPAQIYGHPAPALPQALLAAV